MVMVRTLLDKSDVFTSRDVISAEGLAIIAGMLLSTAGTNQHCQTDVDGPALTVMMQVSIYTKMYTAFSYTKICILRHLVLRRAMLTPFSLLNGPVRVAVITAKGRV